MLAGFVLHIFVLPIAVIGKLIHSSQAFLCGLEHFSAREGSILSRVLYPPGFAVLNIFLSALRDRSTKNVTLRKRK